MSNIFTLAREAGGEPFTFEVDGETLSFPHIADLDQFELAALYADDVADLTYMTGLFTLALGGDVDRLRGLKLSRPDMIALHAAYLAHCGTSAGESSPSSD